MPEQANQCGICLTEQEALALLELVLMCPADLGKDQRAAMLKLSDYCRQFLRDSDVAMARPIAQDIQPVHCAA